MRKIELQDLTASLETGYAAIPIQLSEPPPPLNLCVVVRANPDPASGHFVLIRHSPLADVFLGCLSDNAGRPVDWVEVWVQNFALVDQLHPAFRKNLTNSALERHWRDLTAKLRELDPDSYFSTPYETSPPLPVWIDKSSGSPVHPKDAQSGNLWTLCTDDALLEKAGLPSYSGSLARYLYVPTADGAGRFVPVTSTAPANARTVDLPHAIPESSRLPAFNIAGAPMLFRRFSPLGLDEFAEVLGGKAWRGIENARKAFHVGGVYRLLEDEDLLRCGTAHLFSASSGRSGRFAETLHLKLQMICQAARLVREAVQKSQMPFLNLSSDSFRVGLGATGLGLPFLWTQKLSLCSPGAAFPLPIASSHERYFQPAEPLTASIFRPAELAVPKSGFGSVRIRKVVPGPEGAVIEGTLSSHERIGVDESELIWIQLPSPDGKTDLYGFRDTSQAMAVGEAFFRTIPQNLSPSALASLQAVAGVPFNQVPFSIMPPLSSPCDLYSLGVLSARILLVNPRNDLPRALDSLLSLARQLASSFDPAASLGDRVRKIVDADPRWVEMLGPQHLRIEEASPDEASAGIPARLWWDLLGLVTRFFPGNGQDSFCKGFGDAPALALQTVFDRPLEELNALAIRSRALVTLEWRQNVEIATLIAAAEQNAG